MVKQTVWGAHRVQPPLITAVTQRGASHSLPWPPARVVGNGSLCPVEDTKPYSVPGRALKQEETTYCSLM